MLRINSRLALALCAAVVCVSLASVVSAEIVTFPDANMEAEVRDTLSIPAPTPITDTDMETMGSFIGSWSNISNIQGLEYGTNLTKLDMGYNQISDISAVAGLTKLTELWLYRNQISDISAVAGLTNLTDLWLYYNQISDISAVAGLTKLTRLGLYNNQISDISAVAGLTKLTDLWLDNNQISDISAVAGLTKLTWLSLGYNQISDISAVAGLTKLDWLYLHDNQISDISAVAGLTNLRYLFLKNNQIVTMDISGSNLSLYYFDIADNPLTSVLLTNATLSQSVFDVLMDGGHSINTGIAELAGVLSLAMDGVDFAGISDLSTMYTMDDLETLLLAGASNLDGADVVTLTGELDSLNWLDVTGLWDGFDPGSQGSLNAWDNIAGNTLVTPEPATMSLLAIGGLALLRQRRRRNMVNL